MPCALVLLLTLAFLLPGCAAPFGRRDHSPHQRTGLARKLVVDKREKSMLVAYDFTVCLVTAERFRSIRVGDDVWCNWRREGPDEPYPTIGVRGGCR